MEDLGKKYLQLQKLEVRKLALGCYLEQLAIVHEGLDESRPGFVQLVSVLRLAGLLLKGLLLGFWSPWNLPNKEEV